MENLKKSVNYIIKKIKARPSIALVLGSGLTNIIDKMEIKAVLKYGDIPKFPKSSVVGHKGEICFGKIGNKNVVVFSGRFHYYEGYDSSKISYIVRVAKLLGCEKIVFTNAAGGISKEFKQGDIMTITDHIGLFCKNPLVGKNLDYFGKRFNDMTEAYSKKLIEKADFIAKNIGLELKKGVYVYTSGPSYETPAEINMLGLMGASAVGMSTVPEVIVASHCGLECVAFSCITNMAAGVSEKKLEHKEVLETADRINSIFSEFIFKFIASV